MTDLWPMLILLAVGIVFSVVMYNWWQERKYRKAIERHFESSREDVLTQPSTRSPSVANAARQPLNEDNEGWTSEPRVRGAAKIEPSFVDNSTSSLPATDAPAPQAISDLIATPTEVANQVTPESDTTASLKLSAPVTDGVGLPALGDNAPEASSQAAAPTLITGADTLADDSVKSVSETLFALDFDTPTAIDETSPAKQDSAASEPAQETRNSASIQAAPVQAPLTQAPSTQAPSTQAPNAALNLPNFLHLAIDWVGVIRIAQGAPLVQIADIQTQLAIFSQYTSCWLQFSGQDSWQNLLSIKNQQNLDVVCIACALQLADRGGPVDAPTIERFRQLLLGLGLQLGGELQWLHEAPLKQAHEIDAFSIEVDKAVEFHLMAAQGMFHATKLRGLAEANGLQLSDHGRFDRINSDGLVEFSIRNFEGKPFSVEMLKTAVMTGMTFQQDIPTTPNNLEVFEQMVQLARQFATSLNAEMLDVNRKPIAEAQLGKIRQQLNSINASMQSRGITPGAQHARRLFS